ncbi:TolC family outer membrane protein [Pseudovibrio sp. SPO723]|uniref:TolC family outer membrane protein n=1 Tax=Nesiotobacter zosterae TaxID=392721 RepID=UPI0029C566D4|nr:TolC family outer membrane protein [Pseudovibrio sp. SPO723]MDX5592755.1 TolC family outer membrane protein [Pseudovibrio sp. SPO723]
MSLKEAVSLTVFSNPEIGEAIFNRNAIGFELKQAKGQWLPRLDLEARGGVEWFDEPSTRRDTEFWYGPYEIGIRGQQKIFDGYATTYEIERQRARLDATSFRVWERSEFIALSAVRAYLEVARLQEVQGAARRNISYHVKVATDMREGLSRGAVSVADVQQANERVLAANLALEEAVEAQELAKTIFLELVGREINQAQRVPSQSGRIPSAYAAVLAEARANNPLIALRNADIDAANAQVKIAEAEYYPQVDLEVSSRIGENLEGEIGTKRDARAAVVMRWNIFNGNITKNRRAEEIERAGEARMRSQQAYREVARETRESWVRRVELGKQIALLSRQLDTSQQLLTSYEEQFTVGQRSLLDVLDTQNTVFLSEVAVISARYAQLFTEYRILAAMGKLLDTLGVSSPAQATAGIRTLRDDLETGESLPGSALPGLSAQWRRGSPYTARP